MKNRPCIDCGITYPSCVMDFDHVRGIKRFEISNAVITGYTGEKLANELAKCELVCANCHRIRTYNRAIKKQNANAS
jgi:hypothetical protein